MKIITGKQGTEEWHALRRGNITMSNAAVIMNGSPQQWKNYMDDIRAERSGVIFSDTAKFAASVQHGHNTENRAITMYELEKSTDVQRVCIVIHDEHDDIRGSPDGLIGIGHGIGKKRQQSFSIGGVEAKCPAKQEIHEQTLKLGMPEKHMPQIQGLIWLCGAQWWDFISYAPYMDDHRKRLYAQRIWRDEKYIARFTDRLTLFRSLLAEGKDPVEWFTGQSVVSNLLGGNK